MALEKNDLNGSAGSTFQKGTPVGQQLGYEKVCGLAAYSGQDREVFHHQ